MLTDRDLEPDAGDPEIRIETDKDKKILSIIDNGIGMSQNEVKKYIGTIAKSGSKEFLSLLKENKDKGLTPELIGQFGVGLYSCFMVADKVTITTRKAGEKQGTFWESTGDGTYCIDTVDKKSVGTVISLHLKPSDTEDGLHDYLDEYTIREIVKKYSDYVAYPIKMKVERTEIERDKNGKPKEGVEPKKIVEDETLNSIKAIWTRPVNEVKDEEYSEFYKHISHDWNEPLDKIIFKAEGVFEFRGLLFIPSKAPFDLYYRESSHGIHLYIKRVFIMKDCKELIPDYLRFIKGVIDSEDLSLNISREILQQNRQIKIIKNKIVSKVLEKLSDLKKNNKEQYLIIWKEFGQVIKEGIFNDTQNREKLLELALFPSTNSPDELTGLNDYIERMKDGQDAVYFMTGKSREAIENSPHLETFKDKGYEVLLLTDPVDEIWVQYVFSHKEKPLKSIGKGTVELGTDEEKKKAKENLKNQEKDYKALLKLIQLNLDEYIKEVRLSTRLTSSPVCLVGEAADMTPQMEELMRSMGQSMPKTKRILEVNPSHPILVQLKQKFDNNKKDPVLKDYSELLYGQALLAEGNQPPDPGKFSKSIADLMAKAL